MYSCMVCLYLGIFAIVFVYLEAALECWRPGPIWALQWEGGGQPVRSVCPKFSWWLWQKRSFTCNVIARMNTTMILQWHPIVLPPMVSCGCHYYKSVYKSDKTWFLALQCGLIWVTAILITRRSSLGQDHRFLNAGDWWSFWWSCFFYTVELAPWCYWIYWCLNLDLSELNTAWAFATWSFSSTSQCLVTKNHGLWLCQGGAQVKHILFFYAIWMRYIC